jgi:hypothetical protein
MEELDAARIAKMSTDPGEGEILVFTFRPSLKGVIWAASWEVVLTNADGGD